MTPLKKCTYTLTSTLLQAPQTSKSAPEVHSALPVWGFGMVVVSTVSKIQVEECIFGYLSMACYLLLPIDAMEINDFNLYMPRPHFACGYAHFLRINVIWSLMNTYHQPQKGVMGVAGGSEVDLPVGEGGLVDAGGAGDGEGYGVANEHPHA